MKRNSTDDFFKDRLANFDAGTPMHLWSAIEQQRSKRQILFNVLNYYKTAIGLSIAGISAVLVLWPTINTPTLEHFPIPQPGITAMETTDTEEIHAPVATFTPSLATAPADYQVTPKVSPTALPEQKTKKVLVSNSEKDALLATPISVKTSTNRGNTENNSAVVKPKEAVQIESIPVIPAAVVPSSPVALSWHEPECATFRNGHWNLAIDILVSPDLAFRSLQAKDSEFNYYADSRRETERPHYSFSTGFRVSAISDNGIALRTGLNYTQINEKFNYLNESEERITINTTRDDNGNIITTDTIVEYGSRVKQTFNRYRMIDIPILAGYEFRHKKIGFSINAGAYINLLFSQKGDFLSPTDLQPVNFSSSNPNSFDAFKEKVGIGWYGSLGVHYQLKANTQIIVEPHFKIFPKSFTLDQYILDQKYITTGLFLGLRQEF